MRAGGAGRPWPAVAPLGAWLCGVCGAVRLEGILPVEPGNFSSFVGKFSFDQSLVAGNDSVELSGKVKVRVALEGSWADYTGEIYFMVFDDEVQHWNEDLMGSARQDSSPLTGTTSSRRIRASTGSPVSGCDLRAQSSRYFRVSSRSAQKLHTFLIT
ncbi:unnamed protein product, partial [Prorocentrum cordatum]